MKNIIISGASSGIGRALALKYANHNTNLLLIGRDQKRLAEVKKLVKTFGSKVAILELDVREEQALSQAVIAFDKKTPVDLIIASAGISAGTSGKSESLLQLKTVMDINIYGSLHLFYPLLEKFKARGAGQIVLLGSMASFKALPSSPAYSASKVAIKFLGDSLRAELKKFNVKVNIVFPGYVKTAMTEVNEFPMPFLMELDKATKIIMQGIAKNKPYIIFPRFFYYIIQLTNLLPTRISDYIFSRLPGKKPLS